MEILQCVTSPSESLCDIFTPQFKGRQTCLSRSSERGLILDSLKKGNASTNQEIALTRLRAVRFASHHGSSKRVIYPFDHLLCERWNQCLHFNGQRVSSSGQLQQSLHGNPAFRVWMCKGFTPVLQQGLLRLAGWHHQGKVFKNSKLFTNFNFISPSSSRRIASKVIRSGK